LQVVRGGDERAPASEGSWTSQLRWQQYSADGRALSRWLGPSAVATCVAARCCTIQNKKRHICIHACSVYLRPSRLQESLRKSQTDNLVRRGELVYGDTKTKEEIRAVSVIGDSFR
jgi:hypothetical protein